MQVASRFILIIIAICLLSMLFSCGATASIQGQPIKSKDSLKQSQKDKNAFIITFLITTGLVTHFYNPYKK